MSAIVHIIGAGLAGLSAATILAEQGHAIRLYEANPVAGGRVRTWYDARLGREIDNGNHLVLSGNTSVARYLDRIGGAHLMETADTASFAFADLGDDTRWTVQMSEGFLPWWVLAPTQRIPKTSPKDYLAGLALVRAGADQTVSEAIHDRGPLWKRFWEPLTLAVLNTTPDRGSARLLWAAMRETFALGGQKCRPMFAPKGLGAALVEPALRYLEEQRVHLRTRIALKAIESCSNSVRFLHFADGQRAEVFPNDRVVLALPPTRLSVVMPGQDLPKDDAGILNAHFVLEDPSRAKDLPPVTGLVNTMTHWAFVRGDVISLTISAADRLGLMEADPEELAPKLWDETRRGLGIPDARHAAWRINKERRATIDQSPAENSKRPEAKTAFTNLFLAGDATNTGLPATIEGAIRSGEVAARLAAT